MPIINMASARTPEAALAEMNTRGGSNFRNIVTQSTDRDNNPVDITIYLYDTHVGLCLEDREENGQDDSDFYMLVWNEVKHTIDRITFASTRGWSYPCYGSRPDATPEVIEKAKKYLQSRYLDNIMSANHDAARKPTLGRKVIVKEQFKPRGKGETILSGETGEVCWTGKSDFGVSRYGTWGKAKDRVGVRRADGSRFFIDAEKVQVDNPLQYETPLHTLVEASGRYEPGSFAIPQIAYGYAQL